MIKRQSILLVTLEVVLIDHLLSGCQRSLDSGLVRLNLACEGLMLLQFALQVSRVSVALISDCLESLVDPGFDLVGISLELLVSEGQFQQWATSLHVLMQSVSSVHQLKVNKLFVRLIMNYIIFQ